MGIVLACQLFPAVVLGLPAGGMVAALGPRRALVLCDALRAPLLVAVPVLHGAGVLAFPVLLALVTAIGIFSVPYAAAASSLLPEVVGEDETEVARATAALQVAIQTTGVLGPAIAGLLIPLLGAPNLLLFDGASYAISAAIVASFVRVGRARPHAERVRGVLVGVRHLRRDSLLASIVVVAFAAHVGLAALFASLPALAFRSFHDARTAGVLFTADAARRRGCGFRDRAGGLHDDVRGHRGCDDTCDDPARAPCAPRPRSAGRGPRRLSFLAR